MKKQYLIFIVSMTLWLCTLTVQAQQSLFEGETAVIRSTPLAVSEHKTTHLVFPAAIKSVDRGSQDLLAQPATPADNVLRVKAGRARFRETNLTVITADGALYPFVVSYAENPAVLTLEIGKTQGEQQAVTRTTGNEFADPKLEQVAVQVAHQEVARFWARNRRQGVKLQLRGIFLQGDVMFFRLQLRNASGISYDLDQLRFYVRDRKLAKRTASQEIELAPLYMFGDIQRVAAHTDQVLVVALPKMTIQDSQLLCMQLLEKQGGRHLQLELRNRVFLRAFALED